MPETTAPGNVAKKATPPQAPPSPAPDPITPPVEFDVEAERARLRAELEEENRVAQEAIRAELREEVRAEIKGEQEVPKDIADGTPLTITFLDDGMTVWGATWYKGQPVNLVVGDGHWKATLDRNGDSWLTMSIDEQIERWGRQRFQRGDWDGKPYDDPTAAEAEAKRAGAPPPLQPPIKERKKD